MTDHRGLQGQDSASRRKVRSRTGPRPGLLRRRGMRAAALWILSITSAAAATAAVNAPPVASDWRPAPMVNGYFDHTADWYRRSKRFKVEQSVAYAWNNPGAAATVVLYSDVRGIGADVVDGEAAAAIRARIAERSKDIGEYLDAAARNGNVRVLLQLPDEIVERWAGSPAAMGTVLQEFIAAFRDRPALAGFYVYDEAELHDIPTPTLQAVAAAIRKHARPNGNRVVFSVAYSAVAKSKSLFLAYAAARPTTFDAILVNRYPIYRSYGSGEADTRFATQRLGLDESKARRENLQDNEFANLGNYYDSLVAGRGIPGLDGRPVYAAMQAYGLRDDCDGAACVPVKERKPRRSPTWGELLHMYSAMWVAGLDGAILYSRYFSLHDAALQKRLASLEKLMPAVFANRPVAGPGIELRKGAGKGGGEPATAHARYAPDPQGGKSYYLAVVPTRKGGQDVRVLIDARLRITTVEEMRFDAQGNALTPANPPLRRGRDGFAEEMELDLQGFAVRLFRLRYD